MTCDLQVEGKKSGWVEGKIIWVYNLGLLSILVAGCELHPTADVDTFKLPFILPKAKIPMAVVLLPQLL